MRDAFSAEFTLSAAEFGVISEALHAETGIRLGRSKSTLVYSRLVKRLRALNVESFSEYCRLISRPGNDELPLMCAALTTNVTRFFREPAHFEHLRARVLPGLMNAARAGKRIRIWSAGCSSGEEPYSIALTILSLMPEARSLDIRILATDINPHVLDVGRAGVYPAEEMADVPEILRRSWMDRVDVDGAPCYALDAAVTRLVAFKPLNLVGNWPIKGPFEAIFCRNVVIYFDEATQAKVWSRMAPLLSEHGVLYIGHSERVSGEAARHVAAEGATIYRRVARAAA